MSASIPSPTDPEEEFQQQLQQYAEEFRERINELTTDGINVAKFADFDIMYHLLGELSVLCMSTYMSLRYLEDYISQEVGLVGEDEEG